MKRKALMRSKWRTAANQSSGPKKERTVPPYETYVRSFIGTLSSNLHVSVNLTFPPHCRYDATIATHIVSLFLVYYYFFFKFQTQNFPTKYTVLLVTEENVLPCLYKRRLIRHKQSATT